MTDQRYIIWNASKVICAYDTDYHLHKYILLIKYLWNKNLIIFCLYFPDVEELLGKPVQTELSVETGLDVALDALVDLTNGKV